ncbi:MAG: hypothetical protein A2Y92_05465 [Chloroflexi bacterium RBG_13_57_8]|nr:MAG: hypothetical protein A2Y92_05465 [Chloroflexi bacterium RBG_13_57_8]
MAVKAVEIFKNFVQAWNSEDYEKFASFFKDDLVYEDVPSGRVCNNIKELITFSKSLHVDFPDHKWEIISTFSDGNKIASETIWSGTFTHSTDPKVAVTGKHASARGVSITEILNGKIYRNRDYYDGLSLQQQLGMMPEMKPRELM